MKPIIAITTSTDDKNEFYRLNKLYCEAVSRAGGLPIMVGCNIEDAEQILEVSSGIVLSGGGDIHSKHFNEPLHEKASWLNEGRDAFELALCKMALEKNKPILAICRGEQILNVACGGSLIQHIENHSFEDRRHEAVHSVDVKNGTKLFSILEDESVSVNSIHHQAVGRLGNGLTVCAVSSDGVIEAVEAYAKHFVVGVQWHPEALFKSSGNEVHEKIFNAFYKACTEEKN